MLNTSSHPSILPIKLKRTINKRIREKKAAAGRTTYISSHPLAVMFLFMLQLEISPKVVAQALP